MSGKVADLLNFTVEESSPVQNVPKTTNNTQKSSYSADLLMLGDFMGNSGCDGRKSLDNNPFDKVSKQVENFTADPFEFVASQSKNFKPVMSCIRTGNLLGIGDDSFMIDKENNNNEGNVSPNKGIEKLHQSPKKMSRKSSTDSGKKRDSLLKRSIANAAASKSAMTNNDVVFENQMGEKWTNLDMPDDSFNDLMKQEINLVDSDVSLNDFEAELNIPMLKELEGTKKDENSPLVPVKETETKDTNEISIIDRAIAKLNEIKMKSKESNLEDTMNKLKEMVSKVEGNSEATQLVEQLCACLNKSSENKNTLDVPPPVMVRQGTFDIDKPEDETIDNISNHSSETNSSSPQLQAVIDKLSEVLGNVNMNVIQSSSPDNAQNANPVVVVVVNPEVGHMMSDTVTLAQHYYHTPQPKSRTRRSQSFSSACRPNTVAPSQTRRESIACPTPQRNVQPTRRSFSFNSPAPQKPVIQKRNSILPGITIQKPTQAPSALSAKPATTSRLSFMDKLKPKIGMSSKTTIGQQKKPGINKVLPAAKPSGPMKVIHHQRAKSPNSSVRSLSSTLPKQPPVAQSTPMSRIATPQKQPSSRVSFLTPSKPRPSTASTLTVPRNTNGPSNIVKRRSSFNDKEKQKPSTVTTTNLKPKLSSVTMTRPSTGGLLTQRKFPPTATTTSSSRLSSVTQKPTLTLKMRK